MNKSMVLKLFVLLGLIVLIGGNVFADYQVTVGDLRVDISTKGAWTLHGIQWKGHQFGLPNGWYGTVMSEQGYEFVGSGHTEGGKEELLNLYQVEDNNFSQLSINSLGKDVTATDSYLLVKRSRLKGLAQNASIEILPDGIVQHVTLAAEQEQFFHYLYMFQHCWTNETDAFKAELADGQIVQGALNSDKTWKVKADAKWIAQINTQKKAGFVMSFTDGMKGAGNKAAIYDHSAYHKFYFWAANDELWSTGKIFDAKIAITFFDENAGISMEDAIARGKSLAARPQWETNPVGIEALRGDYVPLTFSPLKLEGTKISSAGFAFDFSQQGFPEAMTTLKGSVLDGPIKLKVNNSQVKADANLSWLEDAPGRKSFSSTGSNYDLEGICEFDSYLWYDLKLKDEEIGTVTLEVPIPAEVAKYVHSIGAPVGLAPSFMAASDTVKIDGMWTSDFRPLIWVGNDEHGVSFFIESTEALSLQIQPFYSYKDGILKITFRDERAIKTDKWQVQFGFMVSPVKKPAEGWRNWRVKTKSRSGNDPEDNFLIYWADIWRVALLDPNIKNPEEVCYWVKADKGRTNVAYFDRVHINGANPELLRRGFTWLSDPSQARLGQDNNYVRVSPVTYQDYLLSRIQMMADLGVNGIYLDDCFPIPNTNALTGEGWTDSSGKRQPSYNFTDSRNMVKRIRYIFEQRVGEKTHLQAHMSATVALPYLAMMDSFLSGEQYNVAYLQLRGEAPKNYDDVEIDHFYYTYFNPQRWQGEMPTEKFGAVAVLLPQLKWVKDKGYETNELASESLAAITLLHDQPVVWPLWCKPDIFNRWNEVKTAFNIGAEDCQFIPYWTDGLVSEDEKLMVSLYRRPGKSLALIANATGEARHLSELSWNTLFACPSGRAVLGRTNRLDGKNHNVADLTLEPWEFLIVELNE